MATPSSEWDLVVLARSGDDRAFADLAGRHRAVLWSICLRITGNDYDAEDHPAAERPTLDTRSAPAEHPVLRYPTRISATQGPFGTRRGGTKIGVRVTVAAPLA